jgi:hypothetical protein
MPTHPGPHATQEAVRLLLRAALPGAVTEADVEAGYERLRAMTGGVLGRDAFQEALAHSLREGLIREPVRLPEGALQCHWTLELTPKGVAAARGS